MSILSYYRKENEIDTVVRCVPELADEAPQHKRPILLWIWVDLKQPVSMECKPKFSDTFLEIESLLTAKLSKKHNFIYCGSIVQEDGASFYYYANSAKGFEKSAKKILESYSFDLGSTKDKHWRHYLYAIYPDALNLQLIEDAQIIENLESSGDNLECEREVEYYFHGASKKDLKKMCDWLSDQGFVHKDNFFNENEAIYHFGMVCARKQAINFMEIYDITRGLFEYCDDHNLRYIGWGTKLCD